MFEVDSTAEAGRCSVCTPASLKLAIQMRVTLRMQTGEYPGEAAGSPRGNGVVTCARIGAGWGFPSEGARSPSSDR